MRNTLKALSTPTDFFGVFRLLASTASILSLFHYASGHGLSSALEFVVIGYGNILDELTQPLLPYIEDALHFLQPYFEWELKLASQWKHIFVLMFFFFAADARSSLSGIFKGIVGITIAAIKLTVGFLLAVSVGVATALVEFDQSSTNALTVGLMPLLGIYLYEIVYGAGFATFLRHEYSRRLNVNVKPWLKTAAPLSRGRGCFIAAAIVIASAQAPLENYVREPGILLLCVGFIALAFQLAFEARSKFESNKRNGVLFVGGMWGLGQGKIAAGVLSGFFWATALASIDAGGQLLAASS